MPPRKTPEVVVAHLVKLAPGKHSKGFALALQKTVGELRRVEGWSDAQIHLHIKEALEDYRMLTKAGQERAEES